MSLPSQPEQRRLGAALLNQLHGGHAGAAMVREMEDL